ncbi:transposase [Mycolicibacillus koreensis]|nr:transposase [Mycolicibacillus koreensis]
MFETADWSKRGDYIAKHNVTPAEANEAIADPERLVIDPDPASKSGRSIRTIGYSTTAQAVLTVIVLDYEGTTYGVNAWKANARDQRRYNDTEEVDR